MVSHLLKPLFWLPGFLIEICGNLRLQRTRIGRQYFNSVEELFGTQRHASLRLVYRQLYSQVAQLLRIDFGR